MKIKFTQRVLICWLSFVAMIAAASTNHVLSLTSPTDYVEIPDSPSLDLVSNFTFEAWVNPSIILEQEQTVISKPRNPNGTGFELRTFGHGIGVAFNDGGDSVTGLNLVYGGGSVLQSNSWHHLAATYDGAISKAYIDGILIASNRFTARLQVSSTPLTIGQKNPPNGLLVPSFLGLIDEARVWNRALTQDEINQRMSLRLTGQELGLVGYWNFDDLTANDPTKYHNNGTLIGGAKIVDDPLVLLQIAPAVELLLDGGSATAIYQIQYKTNATSTLWLDFGSPFSPTNHPTLLDSVRFSPQRIYRIIQK